MSVISRLRGMSRLRGVSRLRGMRVKRESGTKDREMLSVGFIDCRGWWSREVDVKVLLGVKRFDVLGLAEMLR